ncbi:hypothetical protein GF318_04955 [Candidatus Micrarchaeota archaeon]|nr:hypothetical protein [Candidatus Micrarchaeota archaeon]
MKRLVLIFLFAGLMASGCTAPREEPSETEDAPDPDERTFIYDRGASASWPLSMAVASTGSIPGDAYQVYGKTNLTISDCLALSGQPQGKARCLTQAAAYLNDSSICEKLAGPDKSVCYYDYALSNADYKACEKVQTSYLSREKCRRAVALYTGNASLCGYSDQEEQGREMLCRYFAGLGSAANPECRETTVSTYLVEDVQFGESIRWLAENHPGERVLSWWDYGLPLECAGMESVVSSYEDEDVSYVASLLVDANESELASYMEGKDAGLLMVDTGLVSSPGRYLGGKYGALNYISCAYSNETNPETALGTSQCEQDHMWETIFVTSNPCTANNSSGMVAYRLLQKEPETGEYFYIQYYPGQCLDVQDQAAEAYCNAFFAWEPVYCIANTTLSDGTTAFAPYRLDSKELSKAAMLLPLELPGSYHFGDATQVTLFYTKEKLWLENGSAVSGYSDRTTEFYDSALYKALFLDRLEGFQKLYTGETGVVKIFGLK